MNKAEEKRARLERRHPEISFETRNGLRIRLVFEKSEYRAYKYDGGYDKWYDMKLGGLDPRVLERYIIDRF